MLGKTHIINSTAVLNTGLAINLALESPVLAENNLVNTIRSSMLDFLPEIPLTALEFFLVSLTIINIVYLMLRTSKKKMKVYHFMFLVISLFLMGVVLKSKYALEITFIYLFFIFGVLLPDIDSHKSILGRYITPISRAIPHRTITHTIWVVLVLAGISIYFKNIYVFAIVLGYTIHIIQDSFSKCGICWFHPLFGSYTNYGNAVKKKGRNTKFAYSVGSKFEDFLYYSSITINIICMGYFTWWYISAYI